MQANCFVFPSPKNYNLQSIEKRIVLIPRSKEDQTHEYYHRVKGKEDFNSQADEFGNYLREINQICHSLTKQNKNNSNKEHDCDEINEESAKDEIRQSTKPSRIIQHTALQANLLISDKIDPSQYVPCLFLSGRKNKIILFFHANGQDLCSAFQFLRMVNVQTGFAIFAMEYRGYSIYGGSTEPRFIEEDAQRTIQFLQGNRFTASQIIVFGRSIGCAVGLSVLHRYKVYCAVLLSPFISLKKIAKQLYGSCAGLMLKEAFNNQENCSNINCPTLIIHGLKDALVPYEHSLALYSKCQAFCKLKIVENMTHTRFNFRVDFIRHFLNFLDELK